MLRGLGMLLSSDPEYLGSPSQETHWDCDDEPVTELYTFPGDREIRIASLASKINSAHVISSGRPESQIN